MKSSDGLTLREMTTDDTELFAKWLAAPHVAAWYTEPDEWLREIAGMDSEFAWIHHYIAEAEGYPVGFGQYYACRDSGEPYGENAYSIDYLIGETDFLGRGYGRETAKQLVGLVRRHADAKKAVVQPDAKNVASRRTLLSVGFEYDSQKDLFVLKIR